MRCPVCKAQVEQGPQCRRCRADLSLLFALEGRRDRALTEACRCAMQGQGTRLLALAEGVDTLRSDDESRRLIALGYLLQRDFGRAWQRYRRARSSRPISCDPRAADV